MAWLGEELSEKEQDRRTPFSPRCLKDVLDERLFTHRRDLLLDGDGRVLGEVAGQYCRRDDRESR